MSKADYVKSIAWTSAKLTLLAMVMFAFCFVVMVPLYNLICKVAGLNGKTGSKAEVVVAEVDNNRTVEVGLVAVNNENMQWEFHPSEDRLSVHPGETVTTHFYAKNPSDRIMVAQAVPSMVPSNATDYFYKTECFCFSQQVLSPHEEAELGLQFIVDPDLPKAVNSIVLSYTLFDITASRQDLVEEARAAGREQRPTEIQTAMKTQN